MTMPDRSGTQRLAPRKRRALAIPAFGLVVALGLAALAAEADDPRPGTVDLGRTIYVETCASCHGVQLEGQPDWKRRLATGRMPAPPHDASGHTWHHPDQALFRITKEGVAAIAPGYESDMPAFGGVLTDDEIRAVLAYIRSTWPERERAFQAEVTHNATLEDKP
jgi:mono/diheme cytochrome c family protein